MYLGCFQREFAETSLVVQWLRTRLLTQRTWVPSLVRELRSPHGRGQLSLSTTTRKNQSATTKTQHSQNQKQKI